MRYITLVFLGLVLSIPVSGQPTAFSCDGTDAFGYYISSETEMNNGALTYSKSRLSKVATLNGARALVCSSTAIGVSLNGLAFNPQDNFLYAVSRYDGTQFSGKLYRIGENCQNSALTVTAGGNPSMNIVNYSVNTISTVDNGGGNIGSGTFDNNNNYYVNTSFTSASKTGFTNKLQKIEIIGNTATVKATGLLTCVPTQCTGSKVQVNDIIYDEATGFLLGSNYVTNKLYRISTVSATFGQMTEIGSTGVSNAILGMFKNRTGEIRAIDATGIIYEVNAVTGAFQIKTTAADIRSKNADAASGCYKPITVPVELLSFSGEIDYEMAHLKWETTNEINNDFFEIEKLTTENLFEVIGKVSSKNEHANVNKYDFIDRKHESIGVYRLAQMDLDGTRTLSKMITVLNRDNQTPAKLQFTSHTSAIINVGEESVLNIYNSVGQLLYSKSLKEGVNEVELERLYSTGIHFLIVSSKKGELLLQEKHIRF